MKAFITFSIVVLLVMISVSQASKGRHSKLELLFGVFLFFLLLLFVCLLSFFFLQVKMNIKKNNNLCTKTKKQFKQINELRRVGGEGGNLKRK